MAAMTRFQVMLEPKQILAMRRIEERTGAALAEQIRRAVDVWVKAQQSKSPGYVWQKLYEAVVGLVGRGTVQRRLGQTATSLAVLNPQDFGDKKSRETFTAFIDAMSRREDPDYGSFMASAQEMSDDEATQWATKLVSLFNDATTQMGARGEL
jgi:hypothetical protein